MSKRKIEVFTAGCQTCSSTIDMVKKMACSNCEVIVYDLNSGCESNVCKQKAKDYNVTKVPAIAINGKLLECCVNGSISEVALRNALA
jgi:hypothetical protein